MSDERERSLREQLRALRAAPPDNGFSAHLRQRLDQVRAASLPERPPARLLRFPGPGRRRERVLPLDAVVLLGARGAAATGAPRWMAEWVGLVEASSATPATAPRSPARRMAPAP